LFTFTAFIVSGAIITTNGYLLMGLPIYSAVIFGAICAGTSSAVVIPLVRALNMTESTETLLVMESALTDVLSIVTVFALVQSSGAETFSSAVLAGSVPKILLVSPLIGLMTSFLFLAASPKRNSNKVKPLATLAVALVAYGVAEEIGLSGGLAALTFGFGISNFRFFRFDLIIKKLANKEIVPLKRSEQEYYSEAVFILKTFFFIYLGLSMHLPAKGDGFVLLTIVLIYLSRALITRWLAAGRMNLREASLTAVMAPKGLAAAVLAALPLEAGIAGGEIIRDRTYLMVLGSIVLSACAVPLIERGYFAAITRRAMGSKLLGT
jgi:NhaP-type Na+/H+ or K+/H+ antiporter